jgi:hypothetical protein
MKLDLQSNYFKKSGGRKSKPPHRKYRRGKQLVYHGTLQIPTNTSTIYSQITNGSQAAAQSNPAPQPKPTPILVDPPSAPPTGIPPPPVPKSEPPPVPKTGPTTVPKTEPPPTGGFGGTVADKIAEKTKPPPAEVQAVADDKIAEKLQAKGQETLADLRAPFTNTGGESGGTVPRGMANLATGNVQPRSTPSSGFRWGIPENAEQYNTLDMGTMTQLRDKSGNALYDTNGQALYNSNLDYNVPKDVNSANILA